MISRTPAAKAPSLGLATPDPALASLLSQKLFPKYTVLTVQQVADVLRLTKQHVIHLIEEGHIFAIEVGGGPLKREKVTRRNWRIPVSAYDAFITTRKYF